VVVQPASRRFYAVGSPLVTPGLADLVLPGCLLLGLELDGSNADHIAAVGHPTRGRLDLPTVELPAVAPELPAHIYFGYVKFSARSGTDVARRLDTKHFASPPGKGRFRVHVF
jgi:hypothetical protein